MITMFKRGDKVKVIAKEAGVIGVEADKIYTIAAVAFLAEPEEWYVDPFYWRQWPWAHGKTTLDIAGHPQVLFFDEFVNKVDLPPYTPDPGNKNRISFSGYYFEKVA